MHGAFWRSQKQGQQVEDAVYVLGFVWCCIQGGRPYVVMRSMRRQRGQPWRNGRRRRCEAVGYCCGEIVMMTGTGGKDGMFGKVKQRKKKEGVMLRKP